MLTPRFTIQQQEDFLILELKVPFIKTNSVEIFINECEFKFYAKPYFLRLTFPHQLVEDGREFSSYDLSTGILLLKLPKLNRGEHFEDLDLITKLMDIKLSDKMMHETSTSPSTKSTASPTPLIQVLSDDTDEKEQHEEEHDDDLEIDWNFPQSIDTMDRNVLESDAKYGFNNLYQGYGKTINELAQELIDIQDIDHSDCQSRRTQRLAAEELQFDSEYYMWDSVMNEDIPRLLEFKPESHKALKRIQKKNALDDSSKMVGEATLGSSTHSTLLEDLSDSYFSFTEEEQEQMRRLPNKEYLIDSSDEVKIFLGLVDIIYAYCYNKRSTEGEDTVESAWTICRLSGTLSAMDVFFNIEAVSKCCLRRAISFPLYRSFALAEKVYQDMVVMFKLGKRALLKCLLQIKTLISHHESMFLMDRIYLTDYCVWIQKASSKKIASLASQLRHFAFTKMLCQEWDLEKLEQEAVQRKAREE